MQLSNLHYFFLNVFEEVSYAVETLVVWNIIIIYKNSFLFEYILKCNLFLWCKAEFSASFLQSSV